MEIKSALLVIYYFSVGAIRSVAVQDLKPSKKCDYFIKESCMCSAVARPHLKFWLNICEVQAGRFHASRGARAMHDALKEMQMLIRSQSSFPLSISNESEPRKGSSVSGTCFFPFQCELWLGFVDPVIKLFTNEAFVVMMMIFKVDCVCLYEIKTLNRKF